jgi:hypothetical protein
MDPNAPAIRVNVGYSQRGGFAEPKAAVPEHQDQRA